MRLKSAVRAILNYAGLFLISVVALWLLLIATEFISKDAMRDHMKSSADFLCEKDVFFSLWSGMPAGNIDRYSDAVSLEIAWQTDRDHPFSAAAWSSYYRKDGTNSNRDLYDSVYQDKEPTEQYLRYWHGNVVLIRLFHLFTDISGMYICNAVLMILTAGFLLLLLWKHRMFGEMISLIISGILTGLWFVPFSLEYTWVFLITFAVCLVAFWFAKKQKWNRMGGLFLLCGIVTNYLDFLTAETVTLLIPLLLLISMYGRSAKPDTDKNAPINPAIKSCVLWGIGYLGMWVMKWVIASIVLGENVMPYVTGHIAERIGIGEQAGGSVPEAIWRNVVGMIPMTFGKIGLILTVILILILLSIFYVYKKKHIRKDYVLLYAVLGLVPYIRFAVLYDHSFFHFFFTYRAQMATILAISLITREGVTYEKRNQQRTR